MTRQLLAVLAVALGMAASVADAQTGRWRPDDVGGCAQYKTMTFNSLNVGQCDADAILTSDCTAVSPTPPEGIQCQDTDDDTLWVMDGAGTFVQVGGGGANHNILDGSVHSDSAAGTAVRGDVIVANLSANWARLAIGSNRWALLSDGTDLAYEQIDLGSDTAGFYMRDVTGDTEAVVSHTPAEASTATLSIGSALSRDSEAAAAGDVSGSLSGGYSVDSVQANSVALTTDTTGNYAAGDAEAGNALTGDSATSFFSSGEIADAQVANDLTIAGGTIGTSAITLVQGAAPTPTAEGVIEWETDDDHIIVGDGVAAVEFVPAEDVSGDATMADSGAVTVASTHSGSAHHTATVDTNLTTEEVEDIAGPLLATGGTKTGISFTYQDATGDMDADVDHDAATNFAATEHVDWASASAGTIHSTNYVDSSGTTASWFVQTADGTHNTSTSPGSIIGTGSGSLTFAADFFAAGTVIEFRGSGEIDNFSGTFDFQMSLGGTGAAAIAAFAPGGSNTDIPTRWHGTITCRTAGVSGTFESSLYVLADVKGGTLAPGIVGRSYAAHETLPFSVDTTGTLAFDLTIDPSVSNANNGIVTEQGFGTTLNP